MFRPEGIYPALLTPFDEDHRINETELRRIVEFCIQKGLDGLFPVSSVGEGLHMSFEEKCRCMDIVMDQVAGRIPVTPGVVASTPDESARLARHAGSLGCPAVVGTPPYYFKPGVAMVERFFETIVEKGDVPLILYNIPLFTQPLDYDMVKRLSRYEYVVGMKDSSGSMVDFLHFMDKIAIAGEDISLLTGREETLLPCLVMGAKGSMTAMAGIFPEIMVGIYDAWKRGDMDEARTLQKSMLVLVRTMFAVPFPVGFKLGLELRGFNMGPPLMPLAHGDAYQLSVVRSRLQMLMRPLLENYGEKLFEPNV
ncbi:dihydrodipicolinate synthase family protein [Desulfovibrio sp. Fe33]|uniref:dihydrodipicolinate synthase family protein n=1 Tax=Desulfovibrio sp. Fe33 TaxID=3020842 RepID=UPI00234DFEE9|nr:dihydrodipicolinate synthase family protein [Desulfovibrio sp. Fe33]